MLRYFGRQAVIALTTFVAVTAISFGVLFIHGGLSIASNVLGAGGRVTPKQVHAEALSLGLLRPLPVQYLDWLGGVFRGNFGHSLASGESVLSILSTRVPVTASLVVVSLILTVVFSIVIAVIAATRGGVVDQAMQLFSMLAQVVPSFWVALILDAIFGVTLRLVPATGFVPLSNSLSGWISSIILPSVAIAISSVASSSQQLRGAMHDVLRQDYVRTLRARGLSRRAVLLRHVLRNAATPAIAVLSLQVIYTLMGSVVMERIFALPGLGSIALTSGAEGDYPVVLGTVVFFAAVVVGVNLFVDVINGVINPKVRVR